MKPSILLSTVVLILLSAFHGIEASDESRELEFENDMRQLSSGEDGVSSTNTTHHHHHHPSSSSSSEISNSDFNSGSSGSSSSGSSSSGSSSSGSSSSGGNSSSSSAASAPAPQSHNGVTLFGLAVGGALLSAAAFNKRRTVASAEPHPLEGSIAKRVEKFEKFAGPNAEAVRPDFSDSNGESAGNSDYSVMV